MATFPFTPGRSESLRQGRISENFACYAISKNVNARRRCLDNPGVAKTLMNSWQHFRDTEQIKLYAFCIMPDHYHVLFCLLPGKDLSDLMESFSKFTSRQINKLRHRMGTFWQNGFYDHRCRDVEEVYEQALYIEHNPVRKQLVKTAELWPYSSAFESNKWMLDREWWP
jgi:REP element-mobilizing transposase RayT